MGFLSRFLLSSLPVWASVRIAITMLLDELVLSSWRGAPARVNHWWRLDALPVRANSVCITAISMLVDELVLSSWL